MKKFITLVLEQREIQPRPPTLEEVPMGEHAELDVPPANMRGADMAPEEQDRIQQCFSVPLSTDTADSLKQIFAWLDTDGR